jgi:hypothetical protein
MMRYFLLAFLAIACAREAPSLAPPPMVPAPAPLRPEVKWSFVSTPGPSADEASESPAESEEPEPQRDGPPPALADCTERLAKLGVKFDPGMIPVRDQGTGMSCGAPQVVIYRSGPTGLAWNAHPVVTCQMAIGLARFESVLQEEAERALGERVARIQQLGTYSCRKMQRFRLVSEHSYANAIDIRGFVLKSGRTITVKRHFGKLDDGPKTPESTFLRRVAQRAYRERLFSVAITPYWDALHADHFHFDQAPYHVDATGPELLAITD